jgi:hypothetical protein
MILNDKYDNILIQPYKYVSTIKLQLIRSHIRWALFDLIFDVVTNSDIKLYELYR